MGSYFTDIKRQAALAVKNIPPLKQSVLRAPTMLCLLDQINPATQKDSHIISKFIGRGLFNEQGQAFSIESGAMDRAPWIVQTIPKESFIICPECEAYFSLLETAFSSGVYRSLWDEHRQADFTTEEIDHSANRLTCINANPKIIQLFLYSLLWRSFVSSHNLFRKWNAPALVIEGLRKSLMLYKSNTMAELNEKLQTVTTPLYPATFTLMVSEKLSEDATDGILCPIPNRRLFYFMLNRMSLIISFYDNHLQRLFTSNNNSIPSDEPIKIVRHSVEGWRHLKRSFQNHYGKEANEILRIQQKETYDIDAFLKRKKR